VKGGGQQAVQQAVQQADLACRGSAWQGWHGHLRPPDRLVQPTAPSGTYHRRPVPRIAHLHATHCQQPGGLLASSIMWTTHSQQTFRFWEGCSSRTSIDKNSEQSMMGSTCHRQAL